MQTIVRNIKTTKAGSNTVFIGRGSVWGNPFTHLPLAKTTAAVQVGSRDEAIQAFRKWLEGSDYTNVWQKKRSYILENFKDLRGKTLLCYCHPESCHGDVLAEMVNQEVISCSNCGAPLPEDGPCGCTIKYPYGF